MLVPDLDRMLARFVNDAPTAMFIVRLDAGVPLRPPIVYANDSFYRLTGYTRDEHDAGVYPAILGPGTDRRLVLRCIDSVRRGENVRIELKLYRKDRSWFWAEVHTIAAPPYHCFLDMYDVTERRTQEERLMMLSEAVENSGELIQVTDATPIDAGGPRIVYVNRALCESVGREERELIGQRYDINYSPANDAAVLEAIRSTIAAGRTNFRELLIRRKNGSEFWFEFVDHAFESSHGNPMRITVGRDISLRRRASNQVSLFLAALEHSQDRVTLYEASENDQLVASFENEHAARAKQRRLLHLLASRGNIGREIRKKLEAGEEASYVFAETDESGGARVVHFVAQGIRSSDRTEAVLTRERVLTFPASRARRYSPLTKLVLALPLMAEAASRAERLSVLRALFAEHFEAEVAPIDDYQTDETVVNIERRRILFPFDNQTIVVKWQRALEAVDITAMRFCIEAMLELDETSGQASN